MSGNIRIRQLLILVVSRHEALLSPSHVERKSVIKIREIRQLIGSMYHLNSGVCI